MTYERKETGAEAENLAAQISKKSQFKILEMNLTNKLGEIDILARDRGKGDIVVVEVKAHSQPKEFARDLRWSRFLQARQNSSCSAKLASDSLPSNKTIRIDVVSLTWGSFHRKYSTL